MTATANRRTDEELCEAYRTGNEWAFAELVKRYKDVLTNCCRRLGAPDESPAVSVFVQCHEHPPALSGERRFFEWAYRELLARMPQQGTGGKFAVDAGTPRAALALADELSAAGARPEKPAAEAQLEWVLLRLPLRFRRLIVLHDIQGLDPDTVSMITRESPRRTARTLAKAHAACVQVADAHTSLLSALDDAARQSRETMIGTMRRALREIPWMNAPWHFEAAVRQSLMDRQDARARRKRWAIRFILAGVVLALTVYIVAAILRHPVP